MQLIWAEVETGLNRAEVPGGWIVQQYDQRYSERVERWDWILVSAFFVPDALHTWDVAPVPPASNTPAADAAIAIARTK